MLQGLVTSEHEASALLTFTSDVRSSTRSAGSDRLRVLPFFDFTDHRNRNPAASFPSASPEGRDLADVDGEQPLPDLSPA